uniref:VWFD domain-containing protein n=1 Tax=Sinocyclocheilus grahami TaxID=75366 RepID=A0A672LYM3_SINGR
MGNLRFAYAALACNHTCRSLSGPDPTCEVVDDPVEGCGCTSDSHLSNQQTCSPRSLCSCHHPGGVTPPGPVVIGGLLGLCGNFDGKVTNDLLTSISSEVFSVLDFGNSWKTAAPPCSDVTHEIFPCERHSYCAAWAQRRCMILRSDTFIDCHLKVDPEAYYQACVLESCSCEFEGKFLGFCTAVSAYAEACSAKDVCINWRTPDLCPVYCDYYNDVGQCTWHYNPCGQVKTCGTKNRFTGKLEGILPLSVPVPWFYCCTAVIYLYC